MLGKLLMYAKSIYARMRDGLYCDSTLTFPASHKFLTLVALAPHYVYILVYTLVTCDCALAKQSMSTYKYTS